MTKTHCPFDCSTLTTQLGEKVNTFDKMSLKPKPEKVSFTWVSGLCLGCNYNGLFGHTMSWLTTCQNISFVDVWERITK